MSKRPATAADITTGALVFAGPTATRGHKVIGTTTTVRGESALVQNGPSRKPACFPIADLWVAA